MRWSLGPARRVVAFLMALAAAGLLPAAAHAKVYVYTLTFDGTLVKYDPDTDRVELKGDVGRGYITEGDSPGSAQTRVLDLARQRLVTVHADATGAHVVLLNLQARTATTIPLAPGLHVDDIEHLIYPRKASRFYVRWFPKRTSPQPRTAMLTSVTLDGQVLASGPSPLEGLQPPVYHPNGRDFYVTKPEKQATLYHGDTLAVLGTYDLTALAKPGLWGPGVYDMQGGRVLVSFAPAGDLSDQAPDTLFTTDLTFSTQSASPTIATGFPAQDLRLVNGGQTVLLQEQKVPRTESGSGRLHFFDVATGAKLGVVTFPASGADILGIHPDGRRLFLRAFTFDHTANVDQGLTAQFRLVIVDLVSRTIIRNRPFEEIGVASDFVDEP